MYWVILGTITYYNNNLWKNKQTLHQSLEIKHFQL